LNVRLSRLAPAFDRREANHSRRQPPAQRVPLARPPNGELAAKDVPTNLSRHRFAPETEGLGLVHGSVGIWSLAPRPAVLGQSWG
jgi:hypothetical protein